MRDILFSFLINRKDRPGMKNMKKRKKEKNLKYSLNFPSTIFVFPPLTKKL